MLSDTQLKQALAKMLPEKVDMCGDNENIMCWAGSADADYHNRPTRVLATEILHLCWLVEESLLEDEMLNYAQYLDRQVSPAMDLSSWMFHATWQQRITALAQAKGVALP